MSALPALNLNLEYEGNKVRMAGAQDAPLFHGGDVCRCLGFDKPARSLRRLPEGDRNVVNLATSRGESRDQVFVTEGGLYRLTLRSRVPGAKAFQDWVLNDVLPTIRRHGCYPAPDALACAGEDRAIVTRDEHKIIQFLGEHFGALSSLVVRRFDHVDEQLKHNMATGERIEASVDFMARSAAFARKDITDGVKDVLRPAVDHLYDGDCPCCRRVKIRKAGEDLPCLRWDHWGSPGLAGEDDVWPICDACNKALGPAGSMDRRDAEPLFRAFHKWRKEAMTRPASMKGKKKALLCKGQMDLGF